jgi:hypothetical protein
MNENITHVILNSLAEGVITVDMMLTNPPLVSTSDC